VYCIHKHKWIHRVKRPGLPFFESKKEEYDGLQMKISERNAKAEILRRYTSYLAEQNEAITEFDGSLWSGLVDFVTVYNKKDIRVTFKDGTEITV
jgi:hypothetical protein